MRVILKWNVMWSGLKWLRAGCCGHGSKVFGLHKGRRFLEQVNDSLLLGMSHSGVSLLYRSSAPVWPVIHAAWVSCQFTGEFPHFGIISRVVFSADPRLAASISLPTSLFIIILPVMYKNFNFSQRVMTPCCMVVGHHFNCWDRVVFLKWLYHL